MKLHLARETVRLLTAMDLRRVVGGERYYSMQITCAEFTEYRYCNSMPNYCSTTI